MQETITEKAHVPKDQAVQEALQRRGPIPEHIAVIMDGNGRWAKERGRMRVAGHRAGVESVRDISEACAELGVKYLTLYTFSTENWQRPPKEVNALMQLLIRTLHTEKGTLLKNDIRLGALGDLTKLPSACHAALVDALEDTRHNARMTLNLAISYSGRWELVEAMRHLARRVEKGELAPDAIGEHTIGGALTTAGMPDPDLLIRTGGDHRLSNFLLWQIAYAELYITETFWPAFRRGHLYEAIRNFQDRDRRYGRVNDEA